MMAAKQIQQAQAARADELQSEFKRQRGFLLQLARRQLSDAGMAEDAVQETLLSAWQGLDRFNATSSMRTWLVGILRFKLIDALRQGYRQPVPMSTLAQESQGQDLSLLFDEHEQWADMPTAWPNPERDPESQLGQQQLLRLLQACLIQLPEQTGRVFLMREYLGFDTIEVASSTGLTEGHVRVVLCRARMALRTCLDVQLLINVYE